MKKTVTSFILLSFFISAFSQISLSLADMPVAGQTQRVAIDTFPLPAPNFGNKGANQSYDFSNYTLFKYDTIEYRTPSSGQVTTCPNADVATTIDGVNFILTNNDPTINNNKVTLEGFEGLISGNVLGAGYSTKPDMFRFPATYLTNFAGTGYLQKTVPGSQVGQPLATSVELTITTAYSDTIDGWGKVKTPVGTYKCLRKKRKETTTTTIRALIFGTWNVISNSTSTTTRYSYLTKEARGSVINFNYDTANVLQSVNWSMIPPAAPVADFGANNTSGGLVQFTDSTDGYPDTYSWNYGDGSSIGTTQNPNHTYAANGAYYVCLTVTNAGGSNTFCDSVHVTGISSANSAPVATNDTANVLQPNTRIINVGLNDTDPDGDNFCVTATYGSAWVTVAPTGNCTSLLFTPDSTFTGSDTAWYIICDNGTPVLCDTGIVIFTVTPNSALLPVSAFSSAPFTYGNCTGSVTTSNSTNATSLAWTFHPYNPAQPDSVYTGNSIHYYGDMSSTISLNVQVCLTATNQFGTSTKCDTVDLSCTTSIHDVTNQNISLYPNPATNILTIDMRNSNDYTTIEIYNALGEKVKLVGDNTNKSKQLVNVPVSELQQGMYVVTIVDSKGVRKAVGRFTKE